MKNESQHVDAIAEQVVNKLRDVLADLYTPRLLDRHEMAKRLMVSVATLDRLTSDGTVPSVQIKSRRLYHPAKVIDALESIAEIQ